MKDFLLIAGISISLIDLLKETELCKTRNEARKRILNGEVKVDGQIETIKSRKIQSGEIVELDGQIVCVKAKHFFVR